MPGPKFVFQIKSRAPKKSKSLDAWVAIDRDTSDEVALPQGSSGVYLDEYPEIEDYLRTRHKIEASLVFTEGLDKRSIDPKDRTVTSVFMRATAEVTVLDIPRFVFSRRPVATTVTG